MAQAFPWSSNIWLYWASVRPYLLNLCALYQRALSAGATTRIGRLSAERCRWASIASGVAQGGG